MTICAPVVAVRRCIAMTRLSRLAAIAISLVCVLSGAPPTRAQNSPDSPTTQWSTASFGLTNYPDASNDQQTGSAESDIVGDADNPALYVSFGEIEGGTNDFLGFRFRLGADANPSGFDGVALIGIDANLDGSLDLFVGVNNQGSKDAIGIWYPGPGLNISPSTTTFSGSFFESFAQTSFNYSFTPVTPTIDPTATSFDLNGDNRTDYFLSFYVPYSSIVLALELQGITITESSEIQVVGATATQGNTLNQDIAGAVGGNHSSLKWSELGAMSLPFSPVPAVPEPSEHVLFTTAGGLVLVSLFHRRRPKL